MGNRRRLRVTIILGSMARRRNDERDEGPRSRGSDGPRPKSRGPKGRGSKARSSKSRGRRIPADQIDPKRLDRDAKRVVKRLQKHGFEAYFVGGCVRDLLIGRRPKDFDVATSARPTEIRRLFRNCRIIGRRFKLAHIYYTGSIIETATFRAEPQTEDESEGDLLIVDDNEYGTAESDAKRRDFTVNGLFLDPTEHEIIDHVGGLEDLEAREIRTIGDPDVRFAEDPVRILRAIKFATRLDLEIDDPTWDAMCDVAPDLERAAPPRVLEEILRLARSGTASSAFQMVRDVGALSVLVPQLEEYLGPEDDIPERAEPFWDLLGALDARVQEHPDEPPSTALLIAVLYALPFELALAEESDDEEATMDARFRSQVAREVLQPLSEAARLSRKDFAHARRILVAQENFVRQPERFSEVLFCRSSEFLEAFELFKLRCLARGVGRDRIDAWQERYENARRAGDELLDEERRRTRKRKRRRRRRKRRSRSGD